MLLLALLLVAGCSKNSNVERQLEGTWQETANPLGVLEFKSNRTGRAFWPDERGRQVGEAMTWSLNDRGDRVTVTTPPGPVIFEVHPDRLVSPNGLILRKVK
jgi:hypothetical protein